MPTSSRASAHTPPEDAAENADRGRAEHAARSHTEDASASHPQAPHEETPHAESLGDLAMIIQDLGRALSNLSVSHLPGIIDLTPVESMVMNQIDDTPGITPGAVATAVDLKSSNAAAALRALEAHGFVARVPDAHDRRVIHLHPTAKAQTNLARMRAAWVAALSPILPADLDPEALVAQLTSLLRRLRHPEN